MNTIPLECANYADSNPDISGVGVRVSFYLQTFLLVLLVDRSWQDAPIALWTFIATSAGLVLAAVIHRADLTLFQALQVSNLVWLANFGTFFALASYSRQKAASRKNKKNSRRAFDYKVKFGAMAQSLVSMALTLYMWANAKTFGEPSECSHLVKYIFFVIEAQAITVGRVVGLVITSLLTVVYILITLQELYSYRQSYNPKRNEPTQSLASPIIASPSTPLDTSTSSIPSIHPPPSPIALREGQARNGSAPLSHRMSASSHFPQSPHKTRSTRGKRRPKRRRWSSDLDPMLVGIIICQVMVFTYFIVSTELLLKRNPSNDDSSAKWSFGQILALIVIIPSAFSLTGAISEHGVKRLSKRKRRGTRTITSGMRREDPEFALEV
ncbi:hypothetical protein H0H87_012413 [Tephrocybe sp. NHM501043]|nr:hypothetical protein H0H87_012413 [Tephrocybe sp. NHM501043]